MSEEDTQNQYQDMDSQPTADMGFLEMQKLFEKMSFKELVQKTISGLSAPKDSGEYKFARLQIQRLTGPVCAVLVPLIAVILLLCMQRDTTVRQVTQAVDIIEPDTVEEVEEEPPEVDPPDIIEPNDVDVDGPTGELSPVETPTDFTNEPVSAKPAEMNSVALNTSPIVMKGILGLRSPGQRGKALAKYGAGGGDAVVMKALRWLKTQQNEDGSWGDSNQNKTAMTGLAVLVYLAHNETPSPENEEFGQVTERGIKFLMEELNDNGYFRCRDGNNYSHPIGVYALGEAYAMTKNPLIKEAAEKAVMPIIKGQNAQNSWEYGMRVTERSDTSYAGWCVQAIKAVHGAGCEAPGLDECYERAKKAFLCTYRDTGGGFCYSCTDKGKQNTHVGLSGVGALCMQLLGEYNASEVKQTIRFLENCTFDFEKWDDENSQPWRSGDNPSPVYYWYYITQAMFQEGGAAFNRWNKMFLPELIKRQNVIKAEESGYQDTTGKYRDIGYWDSPSQNESFQGNNGGIQCKRFENGKEVAGTTSLARREMDTCLCALQLMVYYRFLPTSQAVNTEDREEVEGLPAATTKSKSGSDLKVKVSKKKKSI